ncbi:MAG: flagellar biosynthetic protein FliO [Clostridiales bacterium]|nr:flagellar biosynthetic protein FliO [Clostridiales bacterium]
MSISCAILTPTFDSSYFLVILSLTMFIALAYVTTVILKRSKLSGGKGRNIHVVERFYLSADKILMIVLVGEVYYLMSYDKTGMKLMDKLENFTPNEAEINQIKFSDLLEKVKTNKER